MTASHLSPFVDISRQKYRKQVREELLGIGIDPSEEQVNQIAEERTRKEIKDGVQTFIYQLNSIMGTNGQTPFITLSLVMEEVLKQRIQGMKNEYGAWVTPAFPESLGRGIAMCQ